MLTCLRIRDLAIVRDLELELGPGLNVLTGETGAGKSILVSALKLVLGARGTPELVGRYAIGSLVVGPVMMFANLELRSVQATDARGAHSFADYLGLRVVMIGVALAAASGIGVLGYDARQVAVIAAFALMRSVESIGDIFHGFAQKHDRMDLVSGSFIVRQGEVAVLLRFGKPVGQGADMVRQTVEMAADMYAFLMDAFDMAYPPPLKR